MSEEEKLRVPVYSCPSTEYLTTGIPNTSVPVWCIAMISASTGDAFFRNCALEMATPIPIRINTIPMNENKPTKMREKERSRFSPNDKTFRK